MKRILLLAAVFVSSSVFSVESMGTYAVPAMADNFSPITEGELGSAINSLVSPTSSERFFEEGRQQLEQELRHLHQEPNEQTSDLLMVDPDIFQQQQDLQQEQYCFEGACTLQKSTLAIIEPLIE